MPASAVPPAKLKDIQFLLDTQRPDLARAQALRLLPKHPGDSDLLCILVACCGALADAPQTLFYAERAWSIGPRNGNLACNLANALMANNRLADAAAFLSGEFERLLGHEGVAETLSFALIALNRHHDGIDICRRAIEHAESGRVGAADHGRAGARGSSRVLGNLSTALQSLGRAEEAIEARRRSIEAGADPALARGALAAAMNYVSGVDPDHIVAAHREFGEALERSLGPSPPPPRPRDPDPDRRLRIGISTPDMREHAVAYFTQSLLEHYDRDRLEVYIYSSAMREDELTEKLRPLVTAWRRTVVDTPHAMAATVRRDNIDVLIDLAGHTTGNRLPAFHLRPAPVQMTWIGYPNTTGIRAIDWRIVDSITDPPGFEKYSVERLLRLDPCFLCYRPRDGAPDPSPPPCLSAAGGLVTFGFFSSLMKLSEATVALWSEVLRAVPNSVLLIKTFATAEEVARRETRSRFVARGLSEDRVIVEGPGAGSLEMLRAYSRIDISLDSVPYHGTTTTCESTWMGVPMVALEGNASHARVGLSILSAVGVPWLVTKSEAEYVRLASELAADRARLVSLRSEGPEGLRAMMARSPLTDGPGMAVRFESAVRSAWRERLAAP